MKNVLQLNRFLTSFFSADSQIYGLVMDYAIVIVIALLATGCYYFYASKFRFLRVLYSFHLAKDEENINFLIFCLK